MISVSVRYDLELLKNIFRNNIKTIDFVILTTRDYLEKADGHLSLWNDLKVKFK